MLGRRTFLTMGAGAAAGAVLGVPAVARAQAKGKVRLAYLQLGWAATEIIHKEDLLGKRGAVLGVSSLETVRESAGIQPVPSASGSRRVVRDGGRPPGSQGGRDGRCCSDLEQSCSEQCL